MKGGMSMERKAGHLTRVQTSCVQDNQVLALSVDRQDLDRCTQVIRQYGLLMPPVVGDFSDGTRMVLSGECEFLALREMGIQSVEAVTVSITEKEEGNKLSLLLSSLKKSPHALSEGVDSQKQIGETIFIFSN
jgi:ParB family chromosome partitioning protein